MELENPASQTLSEEGNRGKLENEKGGELDLNETRNGKKKKKKNGNRSVSFYLPKIGFGCFRVQRDEEGNVDMEVVNGSGERQKPTHLLIMVNGLVGSAKDWKYAAQEFLKTYPEDIIVHCSKRNYSTLTLDGVDVMGGRLAEEILLVIKRHPNVRKISFLCHSLGGLIARYAIAKLYELKEDVQVNGEYNKHEFRDESYEDEFRGRIAGLEPINFITCATPHLGSRGHNQVPMCCGFYVLEKVAVCTSYFFGRTGRHLFLIDNDSGNCPLLFHMAGDREDLKFLSALQSFRRRVTYANVRYDNVVGWSTSSIRRRTELPKRKGLSGDSKYPYIVNVEMAKIQNPQLYVPSEAEVNRFKKSELEGKCSINSSLLESLNCFNFTHFEINCSSLNIISLSHEINCAFVIWPLFDNVVSCCIETIVEEMIKGLSSVGWERVDVDFHRSKQRNDAHLTIQVNRYRVNSDGACVIQHMIDNFVL